jgi:hypothetical protein
MRSNLDKVMNRQISKYERRLQERMRMMTITDGLAADNDGVDSDEDFGPPKASSSKTLTVNADTQQKNTGVAPPHHKELVPLGSNIYASNLKNMMLESDGGPPVISSKKNLPIDDDEEDYFE